MRFFAQPVERLIEQMERLPGIGRKSAQRIAFFILGLPEGAAEEIAHAILDARRTVFCCNICQNLTDTEVCSVCGDTARDGTTVCVVTDPKDVAAVEKTREYRGVYHVLHGVISPLGGVSPDDIRIKELLARIGKNTIHELILATDPDTEGDATAMYISRLVKPLGIRVSRLAYGIPVGGRLEFADQVTLIRAIEGRTEV